MTVSRGPESQESTEGSSALIREPGASLGSRTIMAFPVPSLLSLHSESLAPGESTTAVMGINFCDSTQAANFQLWYVPSPHCW